MAHHTEQAGYPTLPLNAGMKFRLRAISPTTGSAITGITATEWAIYGRDTSSVVDPEEGELPNWLPDGDVGDGA